MKIDTLFLRKLLIAFLVGAAPVIVGYVTSAAEMGGANFTRAALLTVASGAIAAGLRTAMVLIPGLNLVPSDANPILTKTPAPVTAPKP